MEDRAVHLDNGREVDSDDVNTMGEAGALADDRVLAELFRMSISGVAKGVLPYAMNGNTDKAIIDVDVAARTLIINPFRAFVGIRADAAGDGKKLWRDIRSVISPTGSGITRTVTLAANASGNPRWDLVYAVVAVDADVSATRFFKDPGTEDVSSTAYVTKKRTSLSIAVAQGTPAGSPAFPALPPDAGSNYNIPLAYVLVVDGATTLTFVNVMEVAPILAIAPSTSAYVMRPASYCSTKDGAMMTHMPWGVGGTTRSALWMPPSQVGGVTLLIPLRLSGTVSIANGEIVDDKIDWRRRYFKWHAQSAIASDLPSELTFSALNEAVPGTYATTPVWGFGNSYQNGDTAVSSGVDVLYLDGDTYPSFGWDSGDIFVLYVDPTTGALKAFISGTPNAKTLFIWLEASAQASV